MVGRDASRPMIEKYEDIRAIESYLKMPDKIRINGV